MQPIRNTPIQDIRSDSMTFQSFIIFTLNRISQHTYLAVESSDPDKLKALAAEIGFLDSFLGPYYDVDYEKKIKEIEAKLQIATHFLNAGQRVEFQALLRQWVKEIIKRLGTPSIAILPAIMSKRFMGDEEDISFDE